MRTLKEIMNQNENDEKKSYRKDSAKLYIYIFFTNLFYRRQVEKLLLILILSNIRKNR